MMRVGVVGLGYVGCVSAACLASRGHRVVGVDVNPDKVEMVARGTSPVVEEMLGELMTAAVAEGRLHASVDIAEAVRVSDLTLVCVGTPSATNGSMSTAYLERVADQIGSALPECSTRHTVAFRSTMLPGTCESLLVPILEAASGLRAGIDFDVVVNPEFLREGTSVRDFHAPPKTVVGELCPGTGDRVAELYEGLPGPVFRVPLQVAEMTKYVDNTFHALKIGFANEIGSVCKALGVDSHDVMTIFAADRKLNISPAYLRPGFAFGGSCLPKDLRGLVYTARRSDVSVPLLEHVLPSNEEHLQRALRLVTRSGRRKIGLFGLSFKAGTDDLRESPMVELAERLIGKGYQVQIYDENVAFSRLVGANRSFIEDRLPHLGELLTDSAEDVLQHAEVCVVGTRSEAVSEVIGRAEDRYVVDLVRAAEPETGNDRYEGICW